MRLARDDRPFLVTGGAGFIGCNLVDRLCATGHDVIVYDSLARPGVDANLAWLQATHGDRVEPCIADILDGPILAEAVARAKGVFHFAAQVAVTTSLIAPDEDFSANLVGTFRLLEAVRRTDPSTPVVFASTNKVYGDLNAVELEHRGDMYLPARDAVRANGIGEATPLAFHTPYGCSKGAADQYVLDYAHSFGLRTCVLRMSCIYGPHQLGTEDQGWVAHFLRQALAGRAISIFGDGHQVRDILHVDDAVAAYEAAYRCIDAVSGRAFNLGGGTPNAVSLVQLIAHIETTLGKRLDVAFHPWRTGDQRYYVSDRRAIDVALSLAPPVPWKQGVRQLASWFQDGAAAPRRSIAERVAAEVLP